jgi:hypothetical protein
MEYFIHIGIAVAAVFAVFTEGYRLGRMRGSEEKARKESVFEKANSKASRHEESEQERLMRIELENIENYATSVPQQEVR